MNGRTIATSMHVALVAGSLWCGASSPVSAQSLSQYTSEPPFLTEAVAPNILLLMDNSGSMDNSAYHHAAEAYNPAKAYYGYFDPTLCYTYASNRFQIGTPRAATAPTCDATYPWDGNFLNYMTMSRMEIAKWVMMGGKCAPRALNGTCYPDGRLNLETTDRFTALTADATGVTSYTGTRCFDRTGSNLIVYDGTACSGGSTSHSLVAEIASEPTGLIQQGGDKARFGLMEFNGSSNGSNGGKVLADVGSGLTPMVNAIQSTPASTWTPLAESLYEATRYFAQIKPAYSP